MTKIKIYRHNRIDWQSGLQTGGIYSLAPCDKKPGLDFYEFDDGGFEFEIPDGYGIQNNADTGEKFIVDADGWPCKIKIAQTTSPMLFVQRPRSVCISILNRQSLKVL